MIRKHLKYLTLIALFFILQGCKFLGYKNLKNGVPSNDFDINLIPPAPNYSNISSWIEHPNKEKKYARLPKNYIDSLDKSKPKIDVFFVHPTVYLKGKNWNANIYDQKLNKKIGNSAIKHQASIFLGIANIFAPHYRQMHIHSYSDLQNGYKAYDIAYSDVKNAFFHYWKNFNKSKKFIIAGHSQGTNHCERLLKEVILKNDSMKNQLLISYLPGMPITHIHKNLRGCTSPDQLGCFLSWRTLAEGYFPNEWNTSDSVFCVNPISWKTDTIPSKREKHLGILFRNHSIKYPKSISVYNYNSVVWVKPIEIPFAGFYKMKNYHIADYNLFWNNIRNNLIHRLKKNGYH